MPQFEAPSVELTQGFVRATGWVKDMITCGGENHFPAEIEAVLATRPNVAQVAVVGMPDEKWGEVIAAFILSGTAPDVADLRAHLSAHKTPSVWVQVQECPLTGSGKYRSSPSASSISQVGKLI
ncbi:AMP-binding enzyme [Ruegeria sp. MALMAid1280]|uniref:AMP-binding enzyme n=1 Tax=Ruegeria sp. MALMAid1280 TaxID=3411634 RepID=UPI003B9E9FE6